MERKELNLGDSLVSLICSNWRQVKSWHARSPPRRPPRHGGAGGAARASVFPQARTHPGRHRAGKASAPVLLGPLSRTACTSDLVNNLRPPASQLEGF